MDPIYSSIPAMVIDLSSQLGHVYTVAVREHSNLYVRTCTQVLIQSFHLWTVLISLCLEKRLAGTLYVCPLVLGGLTTSGLLCPQAEWCLLFKYVLQFPSLIDEIASFLHDEAFRIVAKVNKVSGISYTKWPLHIRTYMVETYVNILSGVHWTVVQFPESALVRL